MAGKVIEVEVRVGVTRNMGNYESLRLDYSARRQLDPGDNPGGELDSLRNDLFEKCCKDAEEIVKT